MTKGPGIARTKLPLGFSAGGLNCGVRRYRPDLGLITSQSPATAVGVFTQNTCWGAHIPYCKNLLPSKKIKALITNSGQANTGMGNQGTTDNQQMADAVAAALQCDSSQILTASTGVIGQKLEIEKIVGTIPRLVDAQGDSAENFATAVMTTDLIPKTVTTSVELKGGRARITGIAKGSGMIHPNMATMLAYLLTDLKLEPGVAQEMLTNSVEPSFNMISVDGEPSTNDSVFLLANGESQVGLSDEEDYQLFFEALKQISIVLAKSIAKDGEGATKLIEIQIKGGANPVLAKKLARSLTTSPLIKTAVHGRDPNWGRILGRLGSEGLPAENFEKLGLKMQGEILMTQGKFQNTDLQQLRENLKRDIVFIEVDLQDGPFSATAWGCDLSKKYVEINAEYTT